MITYLILLALWIAFLVWITRAREEKSDNKTWKWDWMNAGSGWHCIKADSSFKLEQEVNEAVKKGWRPTGSMSSRTGPQFGDLLGLCEEWKQPMIKP